MFHAVLIIFFSISMIYAQDHICKDLEKWQLDVQACFAKNPSFNDIVTFGILNTTAAFDLVCNLQEAVGNFLECVTNVTIDCLPNQDFLNDFIPSKDNWKKGLEFVCSHRAELIEANSCLVNIPEHFKECRENRTSAILSLKNMTSRENRVQVVCEVLNLKPCIQSAKGSCGESALTFASQVIEKIIPLNKCKNSESSQQAAPSAASSIPYSFVVYYGLGLIAMWLI